MKILLVNTHSEKSDGGGQSLIAQELALKLAELGNECTLLCPGEHAEAHIHESGLIKYTIPSFGSVNVVLPVLNDKNVKKMFQYLQAFHPDIIHLHNLALLETLVLFWAVQHRIPVILTLHHLPSKASSFLPNDDQGKIPIYLEKAGILVFWHNSLLKYCTSAIALNHSTEAEFKKMKYKGRLYKIPNGRSMQPLLELDHKIVQKGKQVRLLFMGLICDRKNQKYLVEMLKFLPENYSLTLVGNYDSDPKYYKKLLDQIARYALTDQVIFTGKIPFGEVLKYMGENHIFVSASKVEVQSLSVLEALGAGFPIVALSNQTTSELLNGANGIVLPASTAPEIFAGELRQLAENPEKQLAMSCAARNTAKIYDWEVVVKLTEAAYADTLDLYNNSHKPVLNKRLAKILEYLNVEYNPKPRDRKTEHSLRRANPMIWMLAGSAMIASAFMMLNWKLVKMREKNKLNKS